MAAFLPLEDTIFWWFFSWWIS